MEPLPYETICCLALNFLIVKTLDNPCCHLKVVFSNTDGSENMGVLGIWIFDQEVIRKKLFEMITIDELSFKFFEEEGFKKFMSVCCPRFNVLSRWIVSQDYFNLYVEERLKLKYFFREHCQRVS